MIIKSFEINKIKLDKDKIILFYGQNEGLKDLTIKNLIKELDKMHMDINEVKFPMTALMIHEHAQGERVAPHIRASIYIPGTGKERTIIDVDWNSWEKLDMAEV